MKQIGILLSSLGWGVGDYACREGFGESGGNLLFLVIWSCKGLGEENSIDIMVEEFIIEGLKVTF